MATKFRETMWFKMGDAPATPEADGDENTASATVAMLPIEDRYAGDVTPHDTATFGLHTGTTEYVPVIAVGDDDVPVSRLVKELKRSKRGMLAVGASIVAACTMLAMYLI